MSGAGAADSCFTAPISGRYFGRPVFTLPPTASFQSAYLLDVYVSAQLPPRGTSINRRDFFTNGSDMGGSSPDWQLQLERDGFVVLPNRVSAEDCAEFREQALSWLEKFPHGFKRDDRSTWTSEHLPYSVTSAKTPRTLLKGVMDLWLTDNVRGGLYNRYSIGHEAFVWKIRS